MENITPESEPFETREEKAFLSQYSILSKEGFLVREKSFRVITLDLTNKNKMMAFQFGDLADSVILGLPGIMGIQGGSIKVEFISKVPMVRFQKHQISMMTVPSHNLLLPYLEQSKDKFDTLAGFFNFERRVQIDAVIKILVQANKNYPVSINKSSEPESEKEDEFTMTVTPSTRSNKVRH